MRIKGNSKSDRMRAYADKQKKQAAKKKSEQLTSIEPVWITKPDAPIVIGFDTLCESYGGKRKR